jgi:hypothetical protein
MSNDKKKVVGITWMLTTFCGPQGFAPQIQNETIAGELSQSETRPCHDPGRYSMLSTSPQLSALLALNQVVFFSSSSHLVLSSLELSTSFPM